MGGIGSQRVVSRAWIIQYTGAAASTVARWYAERGRRPERPRHPEPVCTVGRTIYFDQQAVEPFGRPGRRTSALRSSGQAVVPETGREPAVAAPAVNSGSGPLRWRWTRCAGPAVIAAGSLPNWRVNTAVSTAAGSAP